MKNIFSLTVLLLLTVNFAFAQTKTTAAGDYEMKTYFLVLLKKGENRDQDSITVKQIQEQHLAHLDNMHRQGKLCIAGPLMTDHSIRGICVYNTSTIEEARTLANMDPAVQAGRLSVEVLPWYAAKGSTLP